MKNAFSLLLLLIFSLAAQAQPAGRQTQNVILVTLDGLRWQELFGGVDSVLLHDERFTPATARAELTERFWAATAGERRQKLMPFFWSTLASQGQLYGNRWKGNLVNVTNQMWFSYPGYNEILTGFADDEVIKSNDKVDNPNETVLEVINRQDGFRGRVAAFGSWDVFPWIINTGRSGIPVNAGFPAAPAGGLSEREQLLYELQAQIPAEWSSVRFDAFTHQFALEHLRRRQPRVLYVAYGETDDYAHDGAYDQYLASAHRTDAFIAELWQFVQSHSFYRDKTTLLITTDHGRGTLPVENWKHHGRQIPDADQIWIAAIGPDTPARGEVTAAGQWHQNQIAPTLAALLGVPYQPAKAAGKVIGEVMGE